MLQLVLLIVAVVLFAVAAFLDDAPYSPRLIAGGLAAFAASFIPDAL